MLGAGFRGGGGGAKIKKTTLNKKTDSHSSLSGYKISFYSASVEKTNSSKKEKKITTRGEKGIFVLTILPLSRLFVSACQYFY